MNTAYSTPDIAAVVQEIVNRPGWVRNNEMAFFIQSAPGSSSDSTKRRVADSEDGAAGPNLASRLRVTWTTEKTDPQNQWVGLRFNNVGIPQGAKITSAYLEFVPTQDDAGELEVEIGAYDIGNLPEFTNADYGLFATLNSFGVNSVSWSSSVAMDFSRFSAAAAKTSLCHSESAASSLRSLVRG